MANENSTFAVLVEKANGEYGLLSTTSSKDFDKGDYVQALDKARKANAVKRDNWQQTFYTMDSLRSAEIRMKSLGGWELVSII